MTNNISAIIDVDHIGYAVNDMGVAKNKFIALGYEFTDEKLDELRCVSVSIGQLGNTRVELVTPQKGKKSPIDGILKKMGNMPYHICYSVSNLAKAITELMENGYTQLGKADWSVPLGGTFVSCTLRK